MIAIGSDHAGFKLKEEIKKHLTEKGIAFNDFGTYGPESVDYPVYGIAVAEAVASGEYGKGILVCGTGIGISMSANKVKGIRAAVCSDTFSAHAAREHNNANIICVGERVVGTGLAIDIIDTFLEAEFEGGRHQRRIDLISDYESKRKD